jgi:hypothetical protein
MKNNRCNVYVPPARRAAVNASSSSSAASEIKDSNVARTPSSPSPVSESFSGKRENKIEQKVYVPPGRRNQAKPVLNDWEEVKSGRSVDGYVAPSWTELEHEFKDYITDDKLDACCLIIDNYPSEASDLSRSNEVEPYTRYGCEIKWISRQACLLVFLNESVASKAISCNPSSFYQPFFLYDYKASSESIYKGKFLLYKFSF